MNALAEVRHFPSTQSSQVETRFDPEFGILWGYMCPRPRACFSPSLLSDLRGYVNSIVVPGGFHRYQARDCRIEYAVVASMVTGVFNLGGDLALFRKAITDSDRESLIRYGQSCIDALYPWSRNCDLPLTTIALVQGDALGGGFECALASTVVVAEESARLGFPEILFNLFPGMGAYSFLSRKVGRRLAEELILSGNIYTGHQLYEMGVVDVLAPDGAGEAAVYGFVKKHAKAANGRRAVELVRRRVNPVTCDELKDVVSIWADAALRLTERDLRMMDRLVRAQDRSTTEKIESPEGCSVLSLQRCANQP
jgi:DSF synthase